MRSDKLRRSAWKQREKKKQKRKSINVLPQTLHSKYNLQMIRIEKSSITFEGWKNSLPPKKGTKIKEPDKNQVIEKK